MQIKNGILQGVPFVQTPNQGGRIVPKFITWHWTAGWTAASAISTLTNRRSKASAQFVMDWDGSLTQLGSCERRLWHAGPSRFMGFRDLNSHAIGVEIVNPGFMWSDGKGGYLTWDKKHRVPESRWKPHEAGLVNMRLPKIGGGVATFISYTEAQIEMCRRLTKAICDEYQIISACGHDEIDARGWKADPGPLFPIGEMKALADRFEGRGDGCPRAPSVTTAIVTARSLNVRETPGGKLVGSLLKRGDTVIVHEDRGDWALVHGGRMPRPLWVADRYLEYK